MVRVTVLGSGDAFGAGGRLHSAYVVEAAGLTMLLDCGPTVLQGLKRAGKDAAAIDVVLLSHMHGDHFGGVPFLFMEYRYETPRTRPLTIAGPAGTRARIERLFHALYERSADEAPAYGLTYRELVPGVPLELGEARVVPFVVPHAAELQCVGYRLEIAGRTIVYSGDSAWTEEFLRQARDADLFLCECSTYDTRVPIHLSYEEIAARARDIGCRRLVLTHLGRETLAHRETLTLECAEDGMTIDL